MGNQWKDKRVIFANTNLAHLDTLKVAGFKGTDVIPVMFRLKFEPVQPIADEITSIVTEHGLIPGNYAGVHIRARFPSYQKQIKSKKRDADQQGGGIDMEDPDTFKFVAKILGNAMNCAMQIMPNAPQIYVASDSVEPIQFITHQGVWQRNGTKKFRVVIAAKVCLRPQE